MGSNAQRRREARERVQQMRREEAVSQRRRNALFGISLAVLVVLAIGGIAWAVQIGNRKPEPVALTGVKTFQYGSGQHTTKDVKYAQSPPVGGKHDQTVQNCGVYDAPVRNENAVHSLEHGAVWITYNSDLSKADVDNLAARFDGAYLLVSPYRQQDAPVVATAWNNQLTLDSVDDPRLDAFVLKFRQGPQTPEPGSACEGGTSETIPS